jgi:geranylgeranyl diphosphate synthase type I
MQELLASLESTRALVSERLADCLTDARARMAHVGPETADVVDAAATLVAGGKRLRAAFCVAGWSTAGGAPPSGTESSVVGAGAALELFQAAALVHDDVMDGSHTRRGQPSAHRQFASLHALRRWIGSPELFGEAAAILLGDLLLVTSFRELALALHGVLPERARRAHEIYDLMTAEVTLGQYLDMQAQAAPWEQGTASELDRAERVVRSKSARYSVEHPTVLGAAMAGGDERLLVQLSRFGLPVGEAFQLRDDVLGVFGDPVVTGKPAGDDLREGKRTVLLALALVRASESQRGFLEAVLGRPELDPEDVASVREILVSTGALRAVEDRIEERASAGLAALEDDVIGDRARFELSTLARLAIDRTA